MNYQEQLSPWVIHQFLPNLNQLTIARFRRRAEAESYLKIIQQLRPSIKFAIAFDTPLNPVSAATQTATPKSTKSSKSTKSTKSSKSTKSTKSSKSTKSTGSTKSKVKTIPAT